MTRKHEFLWIDLETTGLDAKKDLVLEFAVVLCADAKGDNLETIAAYEGVIHYDTLPPVDPHVQKMHERNGLWDAVRDSTTTPEEADQFLASLASDLTGGAHHQIVLAGSSVAFDRKFCEACFPTFATYLHYRLFDVRALMRAVEIWCPEPVQWPVRDSHRAMADILTTIDEARIARRAMGWE